MIARQIHSPIFSLSATKWQKVLEKAEVGFSRNSFWCGSTVDRRKHCTSIPGWMRRLIYEHNRIGANNTLEWNEVACRWAGTYALCTDGYGHTCTNMRHWARISEEILWPPTKATKNKNKLGICGTTNNSGAMRLGFTESWHRSRPPTFATY